MKSVQCGSVVRRLLSIALAIALTGALSLGSADYAVMAQDKAKKEDGKKDKGGDGKEEDGEEDEAEGDGEKEDKEDKPESPWKITARLSRAFLFWNDGRTGVHTVDNAQDSSGFTIEGEFKLNDKWTAGLTVSLDTTFAPSDTVDQRNWRGNGLAFELAEAFFTIGHEDWGTVAFGHLDSASDEIDNINLAESDVVADASVDNWIGSFFLRSPRVGLLSGQRPNTAELRWDDFIAGPLAGDTGRFVKYVSPEVNGWELSAAIGQPQEIFLVKTNPQGGEGLFDDRIGGVLADVGVRYSTDLANVLRTKAGFGVWSDTTEERGASEPTEDLGVAGSLALMHIPTGLNMAVNYGIEDHTNKCEQPGSVTRECAGLSSFLYLKGGIARDFIPSGRTAFYGEFYRSWTAPHDSDEDLLRTLAIRPALAKELESGRVTVWGLGLAHKIKPIKDEPRVELYAGYRHYELDLRLLGRSGPVRARSINDVDVVFAGVKIHTGGDEE